MKNTLLFLFAMLLSSLISSGQVSCNGKSIGGWQQLNINYTAAAATEYIQVNIANTSARTTALFDNLTITETPPVIVQENHYDPWGVNLVGIERELLPVNRFKFLRRETQAETGWVDLMQRMYEPPLGRFTSVDPVTASQESLSTYQYGWNNPVLRSDRNGDCPVCIVFAFVALFTASQPANTPTHNKVENARAYQETKRNYDTAIISALTPAPPVSSKPSVIVFQAIKSEVKSEIKNELKKQVQTEIGKSNARSESKYENATLPNSTKNIKTDVTKSEFGANLQKSGYEKTTSKDGTTSVYTKEGNKYSVRDKADSHDGPTADFKKAGSDTKKTDLKIRLEKD